MSDSLLSRAEARRFGKGAAQIRNDACEQVFVLRGQREGSLLGRFALRKGRARAHPFLNIGATALDKVR